MEKIRVNLQTGNSFRKHNFSENSNALMLKILKRDQYRYSASSF